MEHGSTMLPWWGRGMDKTGAIIGAVLGFVAGCALGLDPADESIGVLALALWPGLLGAFVGALLGGLVGYAFRFRPADELGSVESAWFAVHDARPEGWHVEEPVYDREQVAWRVRAHSHRARAFHGASTDLTAAADSEVGVLHEMARCLREIREGRVPR